MLTSMQLTLLPLETVVSGWAALVPPSTPELLAFKPVKLFTSDTAGAEASAMELAEIMDAIFCEVCY